MKTTKEIMELNITYNLEDEKIKQQIIKENQKWFSESDIEQLQKQHVSDTQRLLSEIQKELKDEVNGIIMSELSRDRIQNRIDEVFNNFKGK